MAETSKLDGQLISVPTKNQKIRRSVFLIFSPQMKQLCQHTDLLIQNRELVDERPPKSVQNRESVNDRGDGYFLTHISNANRAGLTPAIRFEVNLEIVQLGIRRS